MALSCEFSLRKLLRRTSVFLFTAMLLVCLHGATGCVAAEEGASATTQEASFAALEPIKWSAIGPFTLPKLPDAEILDHDFGVEKKLTVSVRVADVDGQMLFWQGMPQSLPCTMFPPTAESKNPGVYYALTYLTAPSDCTLRFYFAACMPHTLFLDGKILNQTPEYADGLFHKEIELKRGIHTILVKAIIRIPESKFTLSVPKNDRDRITFSNFPPEPIREIPASVWRQVHVPQAQVDEAKTVLTTKNEVGLPDTLPSGQTLTWTEPVSERSKNEHIVIPPAGDGMTFLMTHAFNTPIYQGELTFLVYRAQPADFYVNGKKIGGHYDTGKKLWTGVVKKHELRHAAGRLLIAVPASSEPLFLEIRTDAPKDIRFFAELPDSMNPRAHIGDWPSVKISNGIVSATVAVPDVDKGFYRGNRFEQAGIITHLESNGHTYFMPAPETNDPLNSGACVGPCEEWFDAIGYDEAPIGSPYIKIGVGLYERTNHPSHCWYYPYWPLKMFDWKTDAKADRIEFTQKVEPLDGWGYNYVKRLVLVPGKPILRIEHELTNTGTKTIDRTQYAHNFSALDGKTPHKGMRIEFDFKPVLIRERKPIAHFDGSTYILDSGTDSNAMTTLTGWPAAPDGRATVTIRSPETSAALRIAGDWTPEEITIYIDPRQLSCEPFYRIVAEPGKTVTWTREYTFLSE